MAGEEGDEIMTLERTPTWAVAIVCSVLIVISVLIEHGIQHLTKFFRKRRKSLYQALYKIKSELMLFGFLSLLLTITKEPISKICISRGAAEAFLPCEDEEISSVVDEETTCHQGKVSLLSGKGVGQLQVLIFVLAFYHVVSCVLTFGLGMVKMRRWEAWEEETRTLEYQSTHDPRRFRLTTQTTFAQRHLKFWSEHRLLRWPVCFLRQFIGSVSKTDYTTLRHGFIMAHLAGGSEFNFQNYLKRAMDKDLQVVVGISIWIWMFSVFFIFFNAHEFYSYLWLPFVPLVMLLIVGTKLQVIITKMCMESRDKASVVVGTIIVKPHDELFWFSRPQLLLHLMHFILFQNSFQLAFFTWTWYKFGWRSCFHRKTEDIVIKMVIGLIVQYLCGYVTLPLYALVTQMGSSMKKAVFTEQVIGALNSWHSTAKGNSTTGKTNSRKFETSSSRGTSIDGISSKGESSSSRGMSEDHTLPKDKTSLSRGMSQDNTSSKVETSLSRGMSQDYTSSKFEISSSRGTSQDYASSKVETSLSRGNSQDHNWPKLETSLSHGMSHDHTSSKVETLLSRGNSPDHTLPKVETSSSHGTSHTSPNVETSLSRSTSQDHNWPKLETSLSHGMSQDHTSSKVETLLSRGSSPDHTSPKVETLLSRGTSADHTSPKVETSISRGTSQDHLVVDISEEIEEDSPEVEK